MRMRMINTWISFFNEGESWDNFIVPTIERKERNSIKVIELIALDNKLTNVNFNK